MTAEEKKGKTGRGWHGDPAGHTKAGQMGGKARAAKKKQAQEQSEKKNK